MSNNFSHVIVIGAGAAGLMCAIEAAKRGLSVRIIEHTNHIGEKIRISGGGRCNFTNIDAKPQHYISENPNFCRSALARYTPQDFISLIEKHNISYHEKKLGQLFCDGSSKQIIEMLRQECEAHQVIIQTGIIVKSIAKENSFTICTEKENYSCDALVIATGGLSIPQLGASSFGYDIARQFGLNIIKTRPALVPLTVNHPFFVKLSGISVDSIVSTESASFRENILFTHRGLSGPAILQISSYIDSKPIKINLLPDDSLSKIFKDKLHQKLTLSSVLSRHLSKRLAIEWCSQLDPLLQQKPLAEIKAIDLEKIAHDIHDWEVTPDGNEGYAKAEVTCGGVDTNALSSKTMEAKSVPGLYFIGEVVDVTGWLGGYNFQWAWSSAVAAGQNISKT